jgi:DnaJ-class molecular chaperone
MKTRKISISAEALCRNCRGTGEANQETCDICEGSGMVTVQKDINVTITPLKKAQSQTIKNY